MDTSNRFTRRNREVLQISHLSHSRHSGGIPSSAHSLSNPPVQEASIFGENCKRAHVQMFIQANTCSQYKSAGSTSPNARPRCSPSHQLFPSSWLASEAQPCLASKAPAALLLSSFTLITASENVWLRCWSLNVSSREEGDAMMLSCLWAYVLQMTVYRVQ